MDAYKSYLGPKWSLMLLLIVVAALETGGVSLDEHLVKKGISSHTTLLIEAIAALAIIMLPHFVNVDLRSTVIRDLKSIKATELFAVTGIVALGTIIAYLLNESLKYHTTPVFRLTELTTNILFTGIIFFVVSQNKYSTMKLMAYIAMGCLALFTAYID